MVLSRAIWPSRTAWLSTSSVSSWSSVRETVLVDPDDHVLALVNPRLPRGGGLLDPLLGHAGGDRLGHAAQCVDLSIIAQA
jgi:hypothetical protein